jgi:hypothetical protein
VRSLPLKGGGSGWGSNTSDDPDRKAEIATL